MGRFLWPCKEESETPTPEYMNDWLLRCNELVENYQPQLFWFDWWIEHPRWNLIAGHLDLDYIKDNVE
jgi:alpha-L-fucosidase